MSRSDAARWAAAPDLPALAGLCVEWLNGTVDETPLYEGGPCEDKQSLAAILTAVNRAALVTDNAGRAGTAEGWSWGAWIQGYASDATLGALRAAVAGTPLQLSAVAWGGPFPEGVSADWDAWIDACPAAACALRGAWSVTIEDPRPGRDDVLWPALEAFALAATP